MPSTTRLLCAATVAWLTVGLTWAADPASGRRKDQEAWKAYGPLVGEWRGVGQVQRGSTKGA